MPDLPSGTVTFLFTDIEGSTKLWEQFPERMQAALNRHDTLMREAIEGQNGVIVKSMGDGVMAAFALGPDALAAALALQRTIATEPWHPDTIIRVRAGLHTGGAELRDGDYFGPTLNRTARLMSVGYGGQTLLSTPTYELVRDALPDLASLRDLGSHRLKDLARPEQVYQLLHPDLPADFPSLKSLSTQLNNLPQQLTSFIGREKEMAEVKALLAQTHLLTLTGTGGTGKTRLSLQVAADVLEEYPEGVWMAELAPLVDPALVPQTVAEVLGVREAAGEPITKTLVAALKDRCLLLILDNCEHVLDAAAQLANAILRACPKVRVLVSSREALGIAGESVYRVPSLSLPDPTKPQTPQSLSLYECVRLFIDRALVVKPDFSVTNANAPSVASVCHRLDGIPLAIELAAARTRSMTAEELDRRLDDCFRLLTGGSRTALPRQQTLRALIAWSYDLLEDNLKGVFSQLSVFQGGWTVEAAASVCGGVEEWEMLDVLMSLADKSLVLAEEQEGATRYRMLEMVRQYATEKLEEIGETESVRRRHCDWFLALAEEANPQLGGSEPQRWLDRLETEHDNLRSALQGHEEPQLRLVAALTRFWMMRTHCIEGRARCDDLLKHYDNAPPSRLLARVLHSTGNLSFLLSDLSAAGRFYDRAAAMRIELDDQAGVASSLVNRATVYQEQGDLVSARDQFARCLALQQEVGDKHAICVTVTCMGNVLRNMGETDAALEYLQQAVALNREMGDRSGEANALNLLGIAYYELEDMAEARRSYQQALSINRELGIQYELAHNLNNLAQLARQEENWPEAESYYAQALTLSAAVGSRRGMSICLDNLAKMEATRGFPVRAACLLGASEMCLAGIATKREADSQAATELTAELREKLGDSAFDSEFERGRAMTQEQAIALATQLPRDGSLSN